MTWQASGARASSRPPSPPANSSPTVRTWTTPFFLNKRGQNKKVVKSARAFVFVVVRSFSAQKCVKTVFRKKRRYINGADYTREITFRWKTALLRTLSTETRALIRGAFCLALCAIMVFYGILCASFRREGVKNVSFLVGRIIAYICYVL